MKKILCFAVFSLSFMISKKDIIPVVLIDHDIQKSLEKPISAAVNNFFRYYHCPDTVYIHSDNGNCVQKPLPNGDTLVSFAYAAPNRIYLCPILNKLPDSIVYNIISCELFHSIAKGAVFVEPFTIFDGEATVLGYHGLAVYVQFKNGQKMFLSGLDEGSAEICAASIVPHYRATNPRYLKVASFIGALLRDKVITLEDLIGFQKNSDFVGLCAKFYKKEKDSITVEDKRMVIEAFGYFDK